MIGIIIAAVILLIFAAVIFLPVTLLVDYGDRLSVKIKICGIKIYGNAPEKKRETGKSLKRKTGHKEDTEKNGIVQAKEVFSRLKKEYGMTEALVRVFSFLGRVLSHIKNLLRHISIYKLKLGITVATPDAAGTAIEYGRVCQAVYPAAAFLSSCRKIGSKEISVVSDFSSDEGKISFTIAVGTSLLYLIRAFFKIFAEYKNFITENDKNER